METKKAIEILKERLEIAKGYPEIHEYGEAIEVGISALEKQIPKKPVRQDIYSNYECPCCKSTRVVEYDTENREYDLDCGKNDYCPDCGQKIDWSEESEE